MENFLQIIFEAIFNPEKAARDMAANGISPEDFQEQIRQGETLAQSMPPANANIGSLPTNPDQPPENVSWREQVKRQTQGMGVLQGNYERPDLGSLLEPRVSDPNSMPPAKGLINAQGQRSQLGELLQPNLQGVIPPPEVGQAMPEQASPMQGPPMPANMLPAPPADMAQAMPAIAQPPPQVAQAGGFADSVGALAQPLRPESATSPRMPADAEEARLQALNAWRNAGINNPYALAALSATGKHESGFSPANLQRTWSDPSESGQAGTSGGMFSWRNERLDALRNFAKKQGEEGLGSPATQALFYAQERPAVMEALKGAKSVEEAMSIMNNDIKFAGYNREGGEAARRMQTARVTFPEVQGLLGQEPTPLAFAPEAGTDVGKTAATATTPTSSEAPAGKKSLSERLSAFGDSLVIPESSYQAPSPPSPVSPSPGRYQPDPRAIQTMLAMLGPMAGGAATPTLAQLLQGGGGR